MASDELIFSPAYYASQAYGSADSVSAIAQNQLATTKTYITSLQTAANNLQIPQIPVTFPTIATPPSSNILPSPALQQVIWTVPAAPAAFTGTIDTSSILPIRPFTALVPTAPGLNFGNQPAPFSGVAPPSPPINTNFIYPVVNVTLPTAPSLLTLDTVVFNPLIVPTFSVVVPNLTAVAPGIIGFKEGALYTSTLLTQLHADLQNALSEGTWTGLPPAAEKGIWDRGREREYRQMADALADLARMETMGFAFPPGVYIDARVKMQTEMQNTTAGLSREVMIKQAELELDNIVKARENATQLESKLIDYNNEVSQRAFEASKYATEASIALYNAQVESYKASLAGYHTQAIVYKAQIEGIEAQVEIVRAQIEFQKTKADINSALVQQYKTEVDAALAVVEIYKTQVEIIRTQAEVEKLKIDMFGAQIQAFVGTVNAYTAQVEGYKAGVEAQAVIENVYKTGVEAYSAQASTAVSTANALIEQYKGQIQAYEGQVDGYKAAVQSMVGQAQAASLFNTATADVFRALTQENEAYNNLLTKQWEVTQSQTLLLTQAEVARYKSLGDLAIATEGLMLDASKVGAQVNAQLGAAALGAIHWASTVSASNSASNSSSSNASTSISTSYNASISQGV